jgi:hypothetical protein
MNWKRIDNWLYRNKEGMIAGALVGFAIYHFNWAIPYLTFKSGVSDFTRMFTLIFSGMTVGALIDNWWRPGK